jgi:hypothetical protein
MGHKSAPPACCVRAIVCSRQFKNNKNKRRAPVKIAKAHFCDGCHIANARAPLGSRIDWAMVAQVIVKNLGGLS